ncbi:hypothetical protein JHK84_051673 [Glycine max]|uniref:Uncharacterized protein n=1 Tax=Glycine max TaxID=3847 RepID=A0A0R0FH06_SOYBN|nr:hypothetical protein JHK85_052486 [Glycine max]KAG5096085.1 hypothetical protein JHK84_051673 [Glycine max]
MRMHISVLRPFYFSPYQFSQSEANISYFVVQLEDNAEHPSSSSDLLDPICLDRISKPILRVFTLLSL